MLVTDSFPFCFTDVFLGYRLSSKMRNCNVMLLFVGISVLSTVPLSSSTIPSKEPSVFVGIWRKEATVYTIPEWWVVGRGVI